MSISDADWPDALRPCDREASERHPQHGRPLDGMDLRRWPHHGGKLPGTHTLSHCYRVDNPGLGAGLPPDTQEQHKNVLSD